MTTTGLPTTDSGFGTGTALNDVLLLHGVTQFLYTEARLLMERRWEEWLGLLADDVHYYMPIRENLHPREADPPEHDELHLALFDDDKSFLTERVRKIRTGVSWSDDPLSRVTYLVSNVQVDAVDEATGEISVVSAFHVNRNRLEDDVDHYTGVRHDRLQRTADGLRIGRRVVLLDQAVLLGKNLSLLF